MKIILLTIIGALILLWGAIWALLKWIAVHTREWDETVDTRWIAQKHLLGLGGYISVVSAILIFLILQTSATQREAALQMTRARLSEELDAFRERLGEIQDKLMGQVAEKAELTQSEWKVRGDLQTERAEHSRTREELRDTQAELIREASAHSAYSDSLNTERALHRTARNRLGREEKRQRETQRDLKKTRADLAKARERLDVQKGQIRRQQDNLKRADARLKLALDNAVAAGKQLLKRTGSQQEALDLLQASVDSIYRKVLKRPRIPLPEPE